MIGDPDPRMNTEEQDLEMQAGFRDEVGPFIHQIIRDEVRVLMSLLSVLPAGMVEEEFPMGGGARPKRRALAGGAPSISIPLPRADLHGQMEEAAFPYGETLGRSRDYQIGQGLSGQTREVGSLSFPTPGVPDLQEYQLDRKEQESAPTGVSVVLLEFQGGLTQVPCRPGLVRKT